MGSDDVRARAEAVLRAIDKTMFGPGQAVAPHVEALRAALAVAPATAKPVMWEDWPTCPGCGSDDPKRLVRPCFRDGPNGTMGCHGFHFPEMNPAKLHAAPPAPVDAAAVREACAAFVEGEADRTSRMGGVWTAKSLAAAIRALPLPAPTEVEKARDVVVEKAKAWVARPVAGRGAYKATAALEESIEALLDAEAAATSRSDDRPAKGQGGAK